jgi:DtxR family Mn-dependent transcriptional regulator
MPDGYHPPLEEYLEAVHELQEDNVPVIQARLAERLGHAAPTVSEMVHRLRDEGYVEIDGRLISLTNKGRHQAESVVRKHRLAERLLTDIIGLEWHKSHSEATRWEHVISDEVEAHLVKILDNPTTCPHGNPIPGSGAESPELIPLADARSGETIVLERVTEQVEFDKAWLTYLGEHHFIPGTQARVRLKDDDGSMLVEVDGQILSIEGALARLLYVSV